MKKFFKVKIQENEIHRSLLNDLAQTKDDLDSAYSNFQNVTEPDLIDCYIYQVNAVQKKYKFLLERVKQLENA